MINNSQNIMKNSNNKCIVNSDNIHKYFNISKSNTCILNGANFIERNNN